MVGRNPCYLSKTKEALAGFLIANKTNTRYSQIGKSCLHVLLRSFRCK